MPLITDEQIAHLKALAKTVTNPRAREISKARHLERNYTVKAGREEFKLYTRQSVLIHDNFSCGLSWTAPDGTKFTLARYNGSDHPHYNPIEGDRDAEFTFHIHEVTERYAAVGRKPEHFAQPTSRYNTLDGALACLLLDWNISGLEMSPQDQLL